MKLLVSFFLAFLFTCNAAANHLPDATPARFYSGHIGKKKVTACIAEKLEYGIYFYQKYGVDIYLNIKKTENGNFLIKEIVEDDDDSTSKPVTTWDVSITAKKIQGVMRIPGKNQDIPIRLKFIEERTDGVGHGPLLCSGIDSNTLSAKNYYALTKVSRPVKTLKTYKNKDVAVEQTFEPASKVSWIRISKHPDPKIKKKLNRLLNTQWQIEVFDALSRLGRGTHVSSRWIADISQQKISARLINDRVLSIEERVWVHYPMDSITRSVSIGINLDLVRGEMITVKDIFTSEYFSDAPSAITNWVKEGYTDTFAKHIHEYLKNAGDEKLERCFDLDMRRDRTEIWLDTSGVWFSRYYLNDATPECRKPIFLPYRVLRKGLTKSALRLLGNNVKRTGIPQQPELPPSTPYPLDQISPDDIFKPNGKQYPIF